MRILITTFTIFPEENGVANVVYNHALELSRRGHDVIVATGPNSTGTSPEAYPFQVHYFDVSGSAHPRNRYRGEMDRYRRFVLDCPWDLILCHCWQVWSTDLASEVFKHKKGAKVLVSHGVSANYFGLSLRDHLRYLCWQPYVRFQMPVLLRRFDGLLTLSAGTRTDCFYDNALGKRMHFANRSVLPNGAELAEIDAERGSFREEFGLAGRSLILCVGNYCLRKNQMDALRAFARSSLRNSAMVFIGSVRNQYAEDLEAAGQSLRDQLRGNPVLVLAGLSRQTVVNSYKSADVFLCPSRWEAFPVVILEAMASAAPFVSYDVGCVTDLPGGMVVQGCDEMASALQHLMENPQRARTLGQEAREACEQQYNWRSIGDRLEDYCQRLVQ